MSSIFIKVLMIGIYIYPIYSTLYKHNAIFRTRVHEGKIRDIKTTTVYIATMLMSFLYTFASILFMGTIAYSILELIRIMS